MKNVRDAAMAQYTSEGKLVRRPLSPHLQTYAPQLTSVLSIMNRVTGIATTFGTALLVWWLVAAASGPAAFETVQWFLGTFPGLFLLFGWTAALMYHFWGGIRHLMWDAGFGYDLPQTHASGWAAIIATVISTTLIWAVGLYLAGGRG